MAIIPKNKEQEDAIEAGIRFLAKETRPKKGSTANQIVVVSAADADANFHNNKEAAKKDFNLACDLWRSYVGKAKTREERLRRIQMFRCG